MVASSIFPAIGQSFIGNVGGVANAWQNADQTLTRPANTTAYAANQALGSSASAIFSFGDLVNYPSSSPFFRQANSSALLSGLRLSVSLAGGITSLTMGSVMAYLFQAAPTAATTGPLVDQGTWTTLLADTSAFLGQVLFSNWNIGGTGSDMTSSWGAPLLSQQPIIAAASTQSLFVVCVSTGAFTPLVSMIYHLHAASVGD